MKKFFLLLLVLLGLMLVGCDDDVPDSPSAPTYNDPSHKTGEFKVIYKVGGETIIHRYDKGEIPDPPEAKDYESGIYNMKFEGWKPELVPVTENTTYEASYKKTLKSYKATFVYGKNGDRTIVKTQLCGQVPDAPVIGDDNDYKFVGWDKPIYAYEEDVTYRAIYTNLIAPEELKRSYEAGLFKYKFHNWGDMMQAVPIFILAYHEHEDPRASAVRDRLIEQIDSLCGKDGAPDLDSWPNWSYPLITASVAIVRDTPTVWDVLTPSQKTKLDTLMEAFAYHCSLATSDYNNYHTGPGLRGNYSKGWNPNYRFANVTNIVFCTYYFGAGDIALGAEKVNEMIRTFDEQKYNKMISLFDIYGWSGPYNCWTKEGIVAGNGEISTSTAKQMLVSGGTIIHTTNDGSKLQSSHGVGVNNGGKDYIYTGYLNTTFTLDECEKIIEDLMYYNYAGGAVKSEHWADGDGDGSIEKVAGIADGSLSPYQGQMGMMLELASGVRSSTSYCSDDFTVAVPILTATYILPRYKVEGKNRTLETDAFGNAKKFYDYTANTELWQMIQVGNEDFLYKYVTGYNSYAHGHYGVSSSLNSEKGNAGGGYYSVKSLWRMQMKPLGDVPIFEDLVEQEMN